MGYCSDRDDKALIDSTVNSSLQPVYDVSGGPSKSGTSANNPFPEIL